MYNHCSPTLTLTVCSPNLLVKLNHIQQRDCYHVTSHVAGGIKLGLPETSGSLLGTDSPWTHWNNKLYSTVLSVLRGVFCDSGFHNSITDSMGIGLTQAPRVGDGQGSLACYSPWVAKSQTQLSNWTEVTELTDDKISSLAFLSGISPKTVWPNCVQKITLRRSWGVDKPAQKSAHSGGCDHSDTPCQWLTKMTSLFSFKNFYGRVKS